ncbi:MAG TPA: hypothetical protein VFM18_06260, partial [Methanosarcina sp.]|nr:hypothetical protein [Methanosarcina sp.]
MTPEFRTTISDEFELGSYEEEAGNSLSLPSISLFYLTTGQTVVGVPFQYYNDSIVLGFTYKVEVIKPKDESVFTVLKPFYPHPLITLYKSSIVYQTSPLAGAEYKLIGILLSERRRELQIVMTQLDLYSSEEIQETLNDFKRRKIS